MSGRWLRALAGAAGALALAAGAWTGGLAWFASGIPDGVAADAPLEATDAIVVLTGGAHRIETGLRLLAEGRARKLFVSGVYRGVEVTELLRLARRSPEAVECCIVLGYEADSTAGNAAETRAWMEREGLATLRLVTANYHMRRSLLEFRRVLPEGAIRPHPVASEGFRREQWWRRRGALALVAGEYNKYLVALARPWLRPLLDLAEGAP